MANNKTSRFFFFIAIHQTKYNQKGILSMGHIYMADILLAVKIRHLVLISLCWRALFIIGCGVVAVIIDNSMDALSM